MRVLFVSRGFPPHGRWGTESYTLQLARGLAARGHEILVLHPDVGPEGPPYALREVRHGAIRVLRVSLPPAPDSFDDGALPGAPDEYPVDEIPEGDQ